MTQGMSFGDVILILAILLAVGFLLISQSPITPANFQDTENYGECSVCGGTYPLGDLYDGKCPSCRQREVKDTRDGRSSRH